MRIALLGWDLEREAIDAVARLGVDVVAFTRWFPGEPEREAHPGWLETRCPHDIGGGPRDEASAFGVAAVRAASNSGLGFGFDVVHAMDWKTRPAAGELAARGEGQGVVLASERASEEDVEESPGFGPLAVPDGWICDHPWGAERLRARLAVDDESPVFTITTPAGLSFWSDRDGPREGSTEGPCAVLTFHAGDRFSVQAIVEGVALAREKAPGLVAAVFGTDPRCERLRRRLKTRRLLSTRWGDTCTPRSGRWNGAVAQAAIVGTAADDLVDDPFARAAWLVGAPVVPVRGKDPEAMARTLLDAVFDRERREADVRIGSALESRRLEFDGVAARWLEVYRRLVDRKRNAAAFDPPEVGRASPDGPTAPFPELRSRLSLIPVSCREALASWTLRPDDWRGALEWLGPESVRAVLTIRLFDVTDVAFDGLNAHSTSDVDLGPGETHRTLALPFDGRSLAACLGVRSRWGYFHPIAHSRICHLPRDASPPTTTPRRLRVLPRRPGA
ncbi:DUF4912 domain-containing protein [Planctomyces sp. SH-PL62]|uniref:DUF4912 domain-containing protein n=1 Tax=Planctomyces sp. SH-PL62 TaxID=1636152 RepID=UPI00078DDDD4|nr:DUF4912 domain-containing protein [Planctomyces sp. SH-PL62]AMV39747.1 hypothetical protein VT85_20105 [Planctomyces sp. SH-PL62]